MELASWQTRLERIGSFILIVLTIVQNFSSLSLLALIIGVLGLATFAFLYFLGDVGGVSRWHPALFRIYLYIALVMATVQIVLEPSYLAVPVMAVLIFMVIQQNGQNILAMALLGWLCASLISDLSISVYCQGSCSYYSWPTLILIKYASLLGLIIGGSAGGYRSYKQKLDMN